MTRKTAADCMTMADIRAEIDRVDGELVALFAERVSYIDRAAVIKDLQTGSFDTVIGKVKLENNMPTRFWWVGQWQNGEFYGIAPAKNEGARTAIVPKPAWVAP